ncbi:976_t:CDS:2, partial [Racocetra fulgida]
SNSNTEKLDYSKRAISRANDLMKDFSEPSNLFGFKLLVEDPTLKFPAKLLINALKLLSDISLFDYYTEDIIAHFELHLRTWVATLEKVIFSSIVLNQEFYDKLYSSLVSFIDIHYHITLFFKQQVNLDNAGDDYSNFQNYNINFLLIHLRDCLHSIRKNETSSDEFLRCGKDFLLKLIRIPPNANGDASENILEIFGGSPVSETLPKLNEIFKKSQFEYLQFKSLELLLYLSYKEPEWFENLVLKEINKYSDSLSKDSLQKFKDLVDNVHLKLQLDSKFIKTLIPPKHKESWLFKEKLSANKSDTLFKEVFIEQLTCPITGDVTSDFLILGCDHLISYNAIRMQKIILSIENKSLKCPFCKTEIELESVYKLSRNATFKGLCKTLEQTGDLNTLMEKQQLKGIRILEN